MAVDVKSRAKRYEKLDFLGEGQFATVYKARDKNTNQIVAIKKIKLGHRSEAKDGINRTALREIKLLQELSHPNIIGLLDAFGHKSNISLVFDFMETDLEVIIKDNSLVLTPSHIKAYMLMTLQGLEYLHQHWILHRDLKPNNLLLDENGVLKLADFGLAKSFGSPNRAYTHQVVTRWYRAPELLFGARMYGVGVDMWAVGCILAELLLRVPFLPGDSDLDQLTRIFETLGTPTEEQWPDMCSLPDFVTFKSFPGIPLQHIFIAAGDDLLDLIQGLFLFNPCTRITATQALKTKYFSNRPGPTPGCQLPRPNCPLETLKEQSNPAVATKRKRTQALEQGHTYSSQEKLASYKKLLQMLLRRAWISHGRHLQPISDPQAKHASEFEARTLPSRESTRGKGTSPSMGIPYDHLRDDVMVRKRQALTGKQRTKRRKKKKK
ncbi:cyclin-dependent kinase 7 isoform X1 [Canis lupus baileyi]|uniref:cyclin-dependent kinase 7 isoform X1 n=2 Tax=Canis lupus familiaris TaxID=9615 RepID=UPI0018F63A8D|nr:cyclin-dependent kinase 7 isoform X1 [Canis lupus familiaris]XP_038386709.1 cyclin-dependent kinase 7 isoform X1 [Canis lupus familiaris]XP_038515007.1 cyclin-dependent kinase 7 isoform X1 [Canis lupus familiaris]XP_048959608.1 cyclin-dependent kinase 7 isoform X1 [Canis lupus dingo]